MERAEHLTLAPVGENQLRRTLDELRHLSFEQDQQEIAAAKANGNERPTPQAPNASETWENYKLG
jgi:hypothetical protein